MSEPLNPTVVVSKTEIATKTITPTETIRASECTMVAVAENATTTQAKPEPLSMAYAREALTTILRLATDAVGGNLDAWANFLRIRHIKDIAEIALVTTIPTYPDALNMAEWRSALEAIADSARAGSISTLPSANLILRTCEKALAAPARNCEKYATLESALAAWREQPPSVGPFDNWLFDYAKESEAAK